MKYFRLITLFAVLLTSQGAANAWFFFIIPGSVTGAIADKISGAEGEHCVGETARVGDRIRLPNGYFGIVQSLSGTSSRCQGQYPIRAKMDIRLPESVRTAEHTVCVGLGAKPGDKFIAMGLGEVVIRRIPITPSQCGSDAKAPNDAIVVSTQAAERPLVSPEPTVSSATPSPALVTPTVANVQREQAGANPSPALQDRTVVERLRELKKLRDENLITQELYEAKQKEILASQ